MADRRVFEPVYDLSCFGCRIDMGHDDVDRIVQLVRRIRDGRTILMVEHNLSVVEGLCDTITVLTRGRILAEGDYASVSANAEVIAAYLGTPHA